MRGVLKLSIGLVLAVAAVVNAADLQAGLATTDITPPKGARLSGYFNERLNTATHDPLQAKAVVFAQGQTRAALVFCDLIGVPADVTAKARAEAARRTGIPADHIMVAGTHTHTGPLFCGPIRNRLHAKATAANGGKDPAEPIDYPAMLVERIAAAAEKAAAAAQPVRLEAGSVEQSPQISFNRRFHMKDGSVRFNPGQQNPEIVRAAGPIDPQLSVVLLRPLEGKPLGCLTVFPLHLDTTGGTEYSADYPYYLEQSLRAELGSQLISLFGTGTCGDINHIDVKVPDRRSAAELGPLLAKTVLAAVRTLKPIEGALAVRKATYDAPLHRFTPEELAKAEQDFAGIESGKVPFLELVRACTVLDLHDRKVTSIPLDVQVFRLSGDLAVVALPGEVFAELGLAIKKASPFRHTLIIELANDNPAYIPTRKAFEEGSYETVNSRCVPGTGEKLVEIAIGLLKEVGGRQ